MNLVLWSAQVLLALGFGAIGFMKTFTPADKLRPKVEAAGMGVPLVRFIGLSELAGAAGLVMPWATGVARFLTPLAAVGIAIIMVLAARFHATRKEYSGVAVNVVLGAIALFVAMGRW